MWRGKKSEMPDTAEELIYLKTGMHPELGDWESWGMRVEKYSQVTLKSILECVQVFSILVTMTFAETTNISYLNDQHRPLQSTLHHSQCGISKRQISSRSSSALKQWVAPYFPQNRVQLPCPACILQLLLPHSTALFTTLSHLPPPPTPQSPEAVSGFSTPDMYQVCSHLFFPSPGQLHLFFIWFLDF